MEFYAQLETVLVRLKHGFVEIIRQYNQATFFFSKIQCTKGSEPKHAMPSTKLGTDACRNYANGH